MEGHVLHEDMFMGGHVLQKDMSYRRCLNGGYALPDDMFYRRKCLTKGHVLKGGGVMSLGRTCPSGEPVL